jgi:hypothetical protein
VSRPRFEPTHYEYKSRALHLHQPVRYYFTVTAQHGLSNTETCLKGPVLVCQNQIVSKTTPWSSPFWEVNRRSACQKFPGFPWNVSCRVHEDLPRDSNQSQMNPVHSLVPLNKFCFNIILPSLLSLHSNGLIALRFQTKLLYDILIPPLRPTYPTYLILLDLIILTQWIHMLPSGSENMFHNHTEQEITLKSLVRFWNLHMKSSRIVVYKEK